MSEEQCAGKKAHGLIAGVARFMKFERRREPLWFRLAATGLVLLTAAGYITAVSAGFHQGDAGASVMPKSVAAPAPEAAPAQHTAVVVDNSQPVQKVAPGKLESGKVAGTQDAQPHLSVVTSPETNTQVQYDLGPETKILLNGSPVKISELKPGDSVKVTLADNGLASLIDATRSKVGIVLKAADDTVTLTTDYLDKTPISLASGAAIALNGKPAILTDLRPGDEISVIPDQFGKATRLDVTRENLFTQFWENFRKNLFKPLLLFFYMGFLIPILKIAFEFPRAVYQGLTIYLLISIGWHGGEELSVLSGPVLNQALGFIVVGFLTNLVIGIGAYWILRTFIPKLRKIDSATVAAYYGSDSAGTFVTCVGVLQVAHIAFAAYMPVMLAVMEIPGCLVGLYLVSRLRKSGMDVQGNMPGEPGYDRRNRAVKATPIAEHAEHGEQKPQEAGTADEAKSNVVKIQHPSGWHLFREVMLNPGLFLLFGGIIIGYISRLQGLKVVEADDKVFVALFQGLLCLFLLEMGMTASRHLKDLTTASWRFVAFGLLAPNIFALTGMCVAMIFSHMIHMPFQLGTYVLFAVLCAAASYIAVPAIQRIAIQEASPTLPLAASLGLTFSYNVTIGIPMYLVIAQNMITAFPVT
jgi:hypothetical protein